MPNENDKPGSTGTDTAAVAEQAHAESLAAFGVTTVADPDKSKTEATPTDGDPAKGTTPAPGSEKDGKGSETPPEPKKWLDKYDSDEAFVKAHSNLLSHKTTIEKENAEMRAELKKFRTQAEQKPLAKETTSKERYLADSDFKAAYEADIEQYGQEAADARLARDVKLFNMAESKKPEADPRLDELHQERLERQLVDKFPELKPDGSARKDFDKLLTTLNDEPSQEAVIDMVAKAALYEHAPELIDGAYRRGRESVLKELKDKGIAATLTADSAAPRSTEEAKTTSDKHRDELAAFLGPDHPLTRRT
jgi:hypothetical protein